MNITISEVENVKINEKTYETILLRVRLLMKPDESETNPVRKPVSEKVEHYTKFESRG